MSLYAGFTRFELELEFVQLLANPQYLHHLAVFSDNGPPVLDDVRFLAYLDYLQYWQRQEYARYITYPEPTLSHLRLLQDERFRRDLADPEFVARMIEDGVHAVA